MMLGFSRSGFGRLHKNMHTKTHASPHIPFRSVAGQNPTWASAFQQSRSNINHSLLLSARIACLVSYATETVMDKCHGKRRCTIPADIATFGNPCRPDSRVYLKVVYTCSKFKHLSHSRTSSRIQSAFNRCSHIVSHVTTPTRTVPRKVLKDRFDYSTEPDEPVDPDGLNKDDLYDEDQFYRESEAVPPAPKLHRELSNPPALADPYATAEPSSSANPPMRSREGNHLEGMC